MKKAIAVFDIGKTNKKFFVFDLDYRELHREYTRFDEIVDEDGFPCENLEALEIWIKQVLRKQLRSTDYEISKVNFSCYGASLVHIDKNGKVLTPLYNYLKPLSKSVLDSFYKKYGPEDALSIATGSPKLGMLNSGMQLYWLKHTRPEVYDKIDYSLHLPQYLSYLFTGIPVSEHSSIGCHTLLWDYQKKEYHDWVYKEGIDKKLPPIKASNEIIKTTFDGRSISIGIGLHDSSSALVPYIRSAQNKFILVSTGTWSITINPFSEGVLTTDDLKMECIFNMRIDGTAVKVARLFLGNEYSFQIKELVTRFQLPNDHHKTVKFDKNIFFALRKNFEYHFRWENIVSENVPPETKIPNMNFEEAYHRLLMELVLLQVERIRSTMDKDPIKHLYIEGGFSDNEVFIQMLAHHLPEMKLLTTDASLGSALGAAIVISDEKLDSKFLKKHYGLKKIC